MAELSRFKSTGGLVRIARAATYSWRGVSAAFLNEAAFRQELLVGIPLIGVAIGLGKPLPQSALLIVSILAVLVVELLNSAIEAIADAVSVEHNELLGRAKDMGSAAVLFSIVIAVIIWISVLWPAR